MKKTNSRILTATRIIVPILLTVLWLGFIFGNSMKTGEESGVQSGKVHEIVNNVAQSVGVQEPIPEKVVRKTAHFTEFAVLGILVCLDLYAIGLVSHKKKLYISNLWALVAIPICAVFASCDELLQNFSEGRGPSIIDVLIDTSGAATATAAFILTFTVILLIAKSIIKSRSESAQPEETHEHSLYKN